MSSYPTEIDRVDFRNLLNEIAQAHMPFGAYGILAYPPRGVPIMDLPLEYQAWFKQREFPKGQLGELMSHAYEIKALGMDCIFDPLGLARGGRFKLRPNRKKTFDNVKLS